MTSGKHHSHKKKVDWLLKNLYWSIKPAVYAGACRYNKVSSTVRGTEQISSLAYERHAEKICTLIGNHLQTDRRAVFTFLLLCTDYYFWWRSKWTVKFSYPTRLNVEGLFLNPTFCSESRLLNWCSSLRLVAHAIWIPLNSYSLPFVGSWWCVFVFYKKKKSTMELQTLSFFRIQFSWE